MPGGFIDDDDDWRAMMDADTLREAREIIANPERMQKAKNRLRSEGERMIEASEEMTSDPMADDFVVLGRLGDEG